MNYIVFDLEWNQGTEGKESEEERPPFEIIEIGAVKLNGERKRLDEFHRMIKPSLYPILHPKTKEIIHIEEQELENGLSFQSAVAEFFNWCGSDYYFCTWGTMDLTELQKNMRYYNMRPICRKPFIYYDVQKLFSLETEGRKNPRTLEYAVDYLKLKEEKGFHRALWDAEYTARVFQRLDQKRIETYYSMDCFWPPQSEREEILLDFQHYTKFISKGFSTKEEALAKTRIRNMQCCICKKEIPVILDWFSSNLKNYYGLGYCGEHGYMKGRIQVNKSWDGLVYAIKIISRINGKAVKDMQLHYQEVQLKKKEKRKSK